MRKEHLLPQEQEEKSCGEIWENLGVLLPFLNEEGKNFSHIGAGTQLQEAPLLAYLTVSCLCS